jgi:hypothetical protein
MELWSNKVSKDPLDDLRRMKVDCRDEIEKQKKINGRYSHIAIMTPLQSILYWNVEKYIDFIYELIKEGANPNIRSNLGYNFFHLFLFLLYYHPIYQTDEHYNIFVRLIRLGMNCNIKIYINNKSYFVLDILYLLQEKPFLSYSFITSPLFKKKDVKYKSLSRDKYDNLVLLLLCLGGQYKLLKHMYTSVKFEDSQELMKNHLFFKGFIQEMFKLPLNISNKEVLKRIKYIICHKSNIEKTNSEIPLLSSKSNKDVEDKDDIEDNIDNKENKEDIEDKKEMKEDNIDDKEDIEDKKNINYFNPEFIENGELQNYEYLYPPLVIRNNITFFHKNFFLELYLNKVNLFTRQNIDSVILQKWLIYIQKYFQFPINSLQDTLDNEPFFFKNKNTKNDNNEYINYIEEFVCIINPYNHINNILYLNIKQIKYMTHIIFYESSLFPKYKQCLKNPSLKTFCDITLYYCRKHPKNISIISYFIEEVFQDFKSYERIKNIIHNLDQQENSNVFYTEYIYRYNEFHPVYMSKFIENILTLNNYLKV